MDVIFNAVDILGFFGDPKRGGKFDLSDIKEGKRTLLIIKALERCSSEQREMMMSYLGDPDLTLEQAERIREIIRETGSEEYSRQMAASRTEVGIAALENAELDGEVVEFLKGFARYLLERA